MLHAVVQPLNYSLRERRKSSRSPDPDPLELDEGAEDAIPTKGIQHRQEMADVYDDDDADSGGKGRGKSRRELPPGAVATLKSWLLSPEHFSHPYPTPQDQSMLMQKTGIDKKQLKNWFTNARRRIWKPMLKKQIESGQLTAAGPAGAPGSVPGLMISALSGATANGSYPVAAVNGSMDNPHSVQASRAHYQQAVTQQQQDKALEQQQQVGPVLNLPVANERLAV
jgi:hypothetical protein